MQAKQCLPVPLICHAQLVDVCFASSRPILHPGCRIEATYQERIKNVHAVLTILGSRDRQMLAGSGIIVKCGLKLFDLQVTMPHNGQPVTIRIGIHSGDCTSGLVGTKLPKFSIFGDTMNTASRWASYGHLLILAGRM